MSVTYRAGDATLPVEATGKRAVIAHVCNDVGAFGAGFAAVVARRYPRAQEYYFRYWAKISLGEVQFVLVDSGADLWVCNMIAQRGVSGPKPWLRLDALQSCLRQVEVFCRESGASLHMPRIGCGIAGSTWEAVGPIVEETCFGLDIHVYDPVQVSRENSKR